MKALKIILAILVCCVWLVLTFGIVIPIVPLLILNLTPYGPLWFQFPHKILAWADEEYEDEVSSPSGIEQEKLDYIPRVDDKLHGIDPDVLYPGQPQKRVAPEYDDIPAPHLPDMGESSWPTPDVIRDTSLGQPTQTSRVPLKNDAGVNQLSPSQYGRVVGGTE